MNWKEKQPWSDKFGHSVLRIYRERHDHPTNPNRCLQCGHLQFPVESEYVLGVRSRKGDCENCGADMPWLRFRRYDRSRNDPRISHNEFKEERTPLWMIPDRKS